MLLLSAPDLFPSAGQRELSEGAASGPYRRASATSGFGLSHRAPSAKRAFRQPAASRKSVRSQGRDDDGSRQHGADRDCGGLISRRGRATSVQPAGRRCWRICAWLGCLARQERQYRAPCHLRARQPFPEDAKLCAALSTFWPAVAPDVYRTMPMHRRQRPGHGCSAHRPGDRPGRHIAVGRRERAPDRAGQRQELRGDGEPSSTSTTSETRSRTGSATGLLAQITTEEYQRRVLAAARVHFVVGGGGAISADETPSGCCVSFRAVVSGDPGTCRCTAGRQARFSPVRSTAWRPASSGTQDHSASVAAGTALPTAAFAAPPDRFRNGDEAFGLLRRAADPRWSPVVTE